VPFRWRGYRMGIATITRGEHKSRRVELIERGGGSLCGRFDSREISEAGTVATAWPDCNDCISEASRNGFRF